MGYSLGWFLLVGALSILDVFLLSVNIYLWIGLIEENAPTGI